nr:unnamed protein product [Callosobruchus analis]
MTPISSDFDGGDDIADSPCNIDNRDETNSESSASNNDAEYLKTNCFKKDEEPDTDIDDICDKFKLKLQESMEETRQNVQTSYDEHLSDASNRYQLKREDKRKSRDDINQKVVVITYKFLARGHTYLEADKVHSVIEPERKRIPQFQIITPWDWQQLVRLCGFKKQVKVLSVDTDDFKNFGSMYEGRLQIYGRSSLINIKVIPIPNSIE